MSPETHVRVDILIGRKSDGYYVGWRNSETGKISEKAGPFPTLEAAEKEVARQCKWAMERGAIEVPGGLPN